MPGTSSNTVNRFTIAAADLTRRSLNPEFATDAASLLFIAGDPLDQRGLDTWARHANEAQMDLIYLAFEPGREERGPSDICIYAERHGIVFRWNQCVLWAPEDGGPLLIMPPGINVCFGHDGLALISLPERPTHSLEDGAAHALQRLVEAANQVADKRLAEVEYPFKQAA
jgi:hypothetical protein